MQPSELVVPGLGPDGFDGAGFGFDGAGFDVAGFGAFEVVLVEVRGAEPVEVRGAVPVDVEP